MGLSIAPRQSLGFDAPETGNRVLIALLHCQVVPPDRHMIASG
jgi:hypothetical protein